ncbi:hypothetical protein RX327_32215 [Bradyrhizobium sp. BEA-2-5]|uniref:hypothetical protein n=1 Tax=Bradyrhizobium sp. BEA-2-5 TaxID=3080015 RepID=UPI00293F4452|nr:hypothetical protein [Bradyrhizobium sp. BEA-2-5]WOH80415.1 hypothetical protein RX327_32215 [Bradyrhizobium sp. BEA-2-5]
MQEVFWWPSARASLVRAVASQPPAIGAEITMTTRPVRLRFADTTVETGPFVNRMSVTVVEAAFAGERCRYLLKSDCGASIVLREASSATIRRLIALAETTSNRQRGLLSTSKGARTIATWDKRVSLPRFLSWIDY